MTLIELRIVTDDSDVLGAGVRACVCTYVRGHVTRERSASTVEPFSAIGFTRQLPLTVTERTAVRKRSSVGRDSVKFALKPYETAGCEFIVPLVKENTNYRLTHATSEPCVIDSFSLSPTER